MDIREVERSTGLERANIRFYEKEGLIQPKRRENGYRDYTAEDVKTLLRVKLLRRLMLSVEEIRSLQEAQVDLGVLLDQKMEELREKQRELAAAQRVCERIREEGMTYASLEPSRYLRMLEEEERRPNQPALIRKENDILRVDQEPMAVHPCKRLIARLFDLAFYGFWIDVIWYGIFRVHPVDSMLLSLAATYLAVLLVMLFEPLWLHFCATTPGKWLMGIRVYAAEGGRLSRQEAWERTKEMLSRGMGWNLPVYGWVRLYRSYKQYGCDAEPLDWDANTEYIWKDQRGYRPWVSLGVWALGVLFCAILMQNAQLPLHRGELTLSQFVENYNDYIKYLYPDSNEYMNDEGQIQEREEPGVVVVDVVTASQPPAFTYRSEDGHLQEIVYTVEYEDPFLVSKVTADMMLGAISFIGAQDNVLWQGGLSEIPRRMQAGEDFTFAGVQVEFEYEMENCIDIGDGIAVDQEDAPSSLRIRMVMRKG